MNQLRIIHTIDNTTGEERIQFTEDLTADVNDYLRHADTLQSDIVAEVKLPSGFPSEHQFIRA